MSTGADQGMNPYTGEPSGPPVAHATPDEVDRFARAAAVAAPAFAALPLTRRADLLRSAAAALESAREELVALADDVLAGAGFPYERRAVEVVSILPERPIDMWFGDFQPERSRRLLAQGRADALAVLAELHVHQGP